MNEEKKISILYKRFKKSLDENKKTVYQLLPMLSSQAGHGSLVEVRNVASDSVIATQVKVNEHLASRALRVYDWKYNAEYKSVSGVMYVSNGGTAEEIPA
tara:strand:- start:145 stop:444 length:300 start_codon:yes stop_codon:yes gene_type:complete